MHISNFIKAGVFVFLLCFAFSVNAQPAWTYDLFGKEKKPEKYEEKLLPSEMSATKKFGFKRKFIQNGISHYNFYFNANNKLNAVLERASLSNKDDYSKLLNFYSYSLDNTASQKTELDSVIYKSTAGILLHDLRSAWVDNFYLLIGKSYYLKKDFDSAALTFQFINYNLFPRKKKNDDDNKIVGSNEVTNGVGSVSIANKENRNILQKTFTLAPSRNDALIWLAKTFIQQNELGDAAGLISILQNDKNLPLRLKNDLEEVTSYWFFVQNNYDSAAIHLENALSNADTKADKSRWQFLLAQMFEISGKYDDAEKYYAKASTKTNDPIMDIYARLNSAKMLRNGANSKELDNSIDKLLRMAKKDKYDGFADIIYYSAAQLSLQKNDTTNGIGLFKKSILKNIEGSSYKDKSFLQLGNIAYNQRDYILAHAYYDSISIAASILNVDSATLADRKDILGRLAPYLLEVEKQDSLQMVAALPENERTIFIKKLVKKYRKENGLKEDVELGGTELITFSNNRNEPIDIFKSSTSNGGQWYFYNASLRAKGYNDFKNKWGKRTNSDNWRRKSATSNANNGFDLNNNLDPNAPIKTEDEVKEDAKKENFSYDGLMANLPLTKELIDSSNGIMAKNILLAAQIFQNELQDYEQAIHTYDEFVNRFANNEKIADAYVGLAFCYEKLGNTTKSNFYKNILKNTFANTVAAKLLDNPSAKNKDAKDPAATAKYENVYNLFLEGKFKEALAEKKIADSSFGKNYWSPQLLYIESVYYIKERKDSLAIATLNNIITLYPTSSLKEKALTMIDVLGRRAAIEKHLTDLVITRAEDEKIIFTDEKAAVSKTTPIVKSSEIKVTSPKIISKVISDSIKTPEIFKNKTFVLQTDQAQMVVMILDKVDAVYVNEAKNAFTRFNKSSMATANIVIAKDAIDAEKTLLLFSGFENAEIAIKYFDKIKRAAPNEVSWLQAAKYSFIIISQSNLDLLKTNKDLKSYKDLLNANFGNKF